MKLDSDLIFINQHDISREELFKKVYKSLHDKNFVKDSYLDAVIARENDHPTAMQVPEMVVAIPHVDIEHVLQERLVVATSKPGILFKSAEAYDEEVKANAIFFLLIKNKDEHLQFLVKLMGLFGNVKVMNALLNSEKNEEVIDLLSKNLN